MSGIFRCFAGKPRGPAKAVVFKMLHCVAYLEEMIVDMQLSSTVGLACVSGASLLVSIFSAEPGAVRLDPVTPPANRRIRSALKPLLTGERL